MTRPRSFDTRLWTVSYRKSNNEYDQNEYATEAEARVGYNFWLDLFDNSIRVELGFNGTVVESDKGRGTYRPE